MTQDTRPAARPPASPAATPAPVDVAASADIAADHAAHARTGMLFAALAYIAWGLFPLYFKRLSGVDALEVIAHRTVWSLVFVAIVLAVLRRWAWLGPVLRSPKLLATCTLSALLLSSNWLVYVWAVQHGHVVEASLGYFINPLVNVMLGFVFLRERLRPVQWLAIGLAAAGVIWLTVTAGRLPWIALVLALSFGFYGLMRKTAHLGALEGLTLETLILSPFAVAALVWWTAQGTSALAHGDASQVGLLLMAGPLTAVPLLLFAASARRITLTTLGLVQYLSPTIQFLLGVWLYHEPLAGARLMGFVLIWSALIVYSAESLWRGRRAARSPSP
jgi:chloramphenicol-sensitive protein RarD